ncbi:hypothetical protein [Altererythrobacter sp. MF3-039]|uniref:hypothetical protein n=1 Tax=Altererythrobacter sp. MF3-039 TaxID=3252901 RepID=UPI00390C88BC
MICSWEHTKSAYFFIFSSFLIALSSPAAARPDVIQVDWVVAQGELEKEASESKGGKVEYRFQAVPRNLLEVEFDIHHQDQILIKSGTQLYQMLAAVPTICSQDKTKNQSVTDSNRVCFEDKDRDGLFDHYYLAYHSNFFSDPFWYAIKHIEDNERFPVEPFAAIRAERATANRTVPVTFIFRGRAEGRIRVDTYIDGMRFVSDCIEDTISSKFGCLHPDIIVERPPKGAVGQAEFVQVSFPDRDLTFELAWVKRWTGQLEGTSIVFY